MESACVDGEWAPPWEPGFASATGMHDGDPFLTADGRTLYFISTRHRFGEVGNGDFDIFATTRGENDGAWTSPHRLPEPVNSTASELLPSMDRSGVLYFGSSRPGGRGGSDIYRATRAPDGRWQVEAVDEVNTAANEYEAEVSADGNTLVVVSDRDVRSRLYVYRLEGRRWVEERRIEARDDVFQVGPRLSPDGRRLLFAQADGAASGELFLVDIADDPDPRWPPDCQGPAGP